MIVSLPECEKIAVVVVVVVVELSPRQKDQNPARSISKWALRYSTDDFGWRRPFSPRRPFGVSSARIGASINNSWLSRNAFMQLIGSILSRGAKGSSAVNYRA